MGSSGIRRRKSRRRLPPARDWEGYDSPPGMMWPEGPTDFEPSAFSPAGRALIGWRFLRSFAWGGRRRRPWLSVVSKSLLLGMVLLLMVGYVASALGR